MDIDIRYNAVFEYEDDGINVTFPDISNACTCGFSREESIMMAKEVLDLILHHQKISQLPQPTPRDKIEIIKTDKKTEIVSIEIRMKLEDGVLIGRNVIESNALDAGV